MTRKRTTSTDSASEIEQTVAGSEGGGEASNSLAKMLGILDLFTQSQPVWSTNDIIQALDASRSTSYRYLKALANAGLLQAVGNGYYGLGPRVIELDLQMRNSDPLLLAGGGVLEELSGATGHSALLSTLFRSSVLCIREHRAPLSHPTLFSRGQRRSLFRGAISKVILAHLPGHRLRIIFTRNMPEIAEARLGTSWEELRDNLARIRKDGAVVTHGEFNAGVVGIAAPVFNSEKAILGSIGIALGEEEVGNVDLNRLIISVKRAARTITQRIQDMTPGMDLPPRAVG